MKTYIACSNATTHGIDRHWHPRTLTLQWVTGEPSQDILPPRDATEHAHNIWPHVTQTVWDLQCSTGVRPLPTQFVLAASREHGRTTDLGHKRASRPKWCSFQHQLQSPLRRGSINWCIYALRTSEPTEIILMAPTSLPTIPKWVSHKPASDTHIN
jgi:hypothetical protein